MNILGQKGGFSLLEVMLAILLFGTGLVFLLQVISSGLFAGGVNENEAIASNLNQEISETLRNTAFSNIAQQTPATVVTGFPAFTREVLVSTPTVSMKQITVNITWSVRGTQYTLSTVSYVSEV